MDRERPGSEMGWLVPKCNACGLFKTCQSPKMIPQGEGKMRVLVVGEAPGQTEDEEGRPFVGKAGEKLRETLKGLEIDLDRDALTTNALICRPPKNATPKPKQIGYCRPNLQKTIRKFLPNVIVTLGRSALLSVIEPFWRDVEALERWVGWRIPLEAYWVCPTYHPSYLLRMNNTLMDRAFAEHLQQAFSIGDPPPKQENLRKKITLLYDDREIHDAVREVHRGGGWVAVDYETNCLKPEYPNAEIVSCAISNGEQTFSFPWIGKAIEAMDKFLSAPRTRKIASNLKFEERWTLKVFGHGVNNWGWDTMLAAHTLDNRPHICSLKFQSFIKMGVASYNEDILPFLFSQGHYNRIEEVELDRLLTYGGMDALLEHRLAAIQREEMRYEN